MTNFFKPNTFFFIFKTNRILAFAFLFLGIGSIAFAQKATFLNGNITKDTLLQSVKLLKEQNGTYITIDSANIDVKGDFKFKITLKDPDFYFLKFEPGNKPYAHVVLHPNQTLTMQLEMNEIPEYVSVTGSNDMKQMQEVLALLEQTKKQLNTLQQEHVAATDKIGVEAKINRLILDFQNTVKTKLLKNKDLLSSALLVTILNFDDYFETYEQMATALKKKYPTNGEVKKLVLKTKSEFPEIELPNPESEILKLSSLKGKYVLIDFWASWCGPCRRENPHVVALYNQYNAKGFDIFSVSLDRDRTAWTNAIKADGLVWKNHVSDLKQWQSVVVSQFGVSGIPYTLLLDKNGKVIAKGLRGEALSAKLSELFK